MLHKPQAQHNFSSPLFIPIEKQFFTPILPTMPQESAQNQQAAFSALYLQKLTQELSEDLDKIRNADDFKAESVPSLVHALQQGAKQFSPAQQNAVLKTSEGRRG
ncbi:ribosome-assembly protein 3 domain-containing protein [Trichoderma chlorosporum]